MNTFITFFNLLIFIFFIFYLGYILLQILKYKRNELSDSNIVIVVNEPKESTYIEKLTNRLFIIIGCIFIIFMIMTIFTTGIDNHVFPVYLLIFYVNIWHMLYNKKLGFIITQKGLIIGLQFIQWDKIRKYKWVKNTREKNKITLKIKKYKSLSEIPIDINVYDKDRIEKIFKNYLTVNKM
ncbi:hypothetical protein TR13x_03200 [Caloranaerobacter sp. TR13]|uniref:DUF5673 domain-containing protein n=1 Tax=Caloranaerobacter sp. TR13 TaxID=1302151 RepID=UPI0006D41320|nr:DUF5673 domain-containing protein [Caloranaerobacter sp. TR13]KPU28352.1 hypothetical protein TR13x_03200 [Caloranaerobacter sp. TR13]